MSTRTSEETNALATNDVCPPLRVALSCGALLAAAITFSVYDLVRVG